MGQQAKRHAFGLQKPLSRQDYLMPITGTDPTLPNYARPEYVAAAPDLKLIADELGGTRAMHAASGGDGTGAGGYIAKWAAEAPENYNRRRKCETFFEGFGRTLSAAIGMLFAKPPQMVWNASEASFADHWQNIDGAGTAGPVFAKRFGEAAIKDGLAVILVDHAPPPPGVLVHFGNEGTLGLRPTWAMYERGGAINWRTAKIGGEVVFTLLVLYESATAPDGAYGVKVKHRYRVLRLTDSLSARSMMDQTPTPTQAEDDNPMWATWQLWELVDEQHGAKTEDFTLADQGVFTNRRGEVAARLPVAIGYAGRSTAPMQSTIPLMGVVWANLSHWQLSSELRFNTSVAAFAQPVVKGNLRSEIDATGAHRPGELRIGPLVAIYTEAEGDFKWVEPEGTGLERLAKLVIGKLEEMAAAGLSFLQRDKRAAETAEARAMDAAAENATLATAAQGVEDAFNTALGIHAWYLGIPDTGAPMMTISRDYEHTALAADIMNAYTQAIEKAGLPPRIMLEAFQKGGRIPSDMDLDAVEMEMMAQQAATAEEEAARGPELVA